MLWSAALACGGNTAGKGSRDLGAGDLSMVGTPADLSTRADLAGDSSLGEACGGFTANPKQCLPGLVCMLNPIPDTGGICASPDAGVCKANGQSCAGSNECCSMNCVIRTSPGVCCVPGGCP